MSLVVPDTSVLIEVFRFEEAAEEAEKRKWRWRMSAVVYSELLRGVDRPAELRYVRSLQRAFPPIAPTQAEWGRCGEILGRLRLEHHFEGRGLMAIQNDTLIALTARGLGVPVVTANVADFELVAAQIRGLSIVAFPAR